MTASLSSRGLQKKPSPVVYFTEEEKGSQAVTRPRSYTELLAELGIMKAASPNLSAVLIIKSQRGYFSK